MSRISGEIGKKESGPEGVQAVVLALRLLEYLASQRRPVGVTALAAALGTTKSRIHRHLRTLVQLKYIVQSEETERYRVGTRLLTLGRAVSETFDLANAAQDVLRRLRDEQGHSCVVSQVEKDGVRVLATISNDSAIEIGVRRGSLLQFHSSAQGKVALAFGSAEIREQAFRSKLKRATPSTIVSQQALRKDVERIRQRGWAVAPNEALIGLNTLAAPIFDASGAFVGTIGMVDSIQFIPEEPTAEQIRGILTAARRISEALGHSVD